MSGGSGGRQGAGVLEPGPVIAGLGEDSGAGQGAGAGNAADEQRVRVLLGGLGCGSFQLAGIAAGGGGLSQQGGRLLAGCGFGLRGGGRVPVLEDFMEPAGLCSGTTEPAGRRRDWSRRV